MQCLGVRFGTFFFVTQLDSRFLLLGSFNAKVSGFGFGQHFEDASDCDEGNSF